MPRSKPYQDELIRYLKTPERAIAYLNAAIEAGDPQLFSIALNNVAQAHKGSTPGVEKAIDSDRTDTQNQELNRFLILLNSLGLSLTQSETRRAS
jgi:DNA-binding phage protein